jgi:hypothetical protein
MRKFISNKKGYFFMGDDPSFFQKKKFEKFGSFLVTELEDARNTWYLHR